jgi:glyoxylase I family protein
MAVEHLPLGSIKYVRILVSDLERSKEFYSDVLGFEVETESIPPREREGGKTQLGGVIMSYGGMLFGLRPVPGGGLRRGQLAPGELDRLAFNVASRKELRRALQMLDERGIEHGPIEEVPAFKVCYFPLFDPDGLALELVAPLDDGT